MANPNNYPDKNFFRFSEVHLSAMGAAWEFSFDRTIAAGAKENIIFVMKNTQVTFISLGMSVAASNQPQSFVSTMFRAPTYNGGIAESIFPLNDNIQFPPSPETMDLLSGAVVTNTGVQVYPSKTHGVDKQESAALGHHGIFFCRKNETYLHEMENTSGQSALVTLQGIIAYSTD